MLTFSKDFKSLLNKESFYLNGNQIRIDKKFNIDILSYPSFYNRLPL